MDYRGYPADNDADPGEPEPSSPAQSGQEDTDDNDRLVLPQSPDDEADDIDNRPESNEDRPSRRNNHVSFASGGGDHQMPGTSGIVGGSHDFVLAAEDSQVDDGDPQPGPSSASGFHHNNRSGVSCSNEGSNSNEVWAASSSASRDLTEDISGDSVDGGEVAPVYERLGQNEDAATSSSSPFSSSSTVASTSSARIITVSLASFSPQPSSSSSLNNSVANNRPSQSSSNSVYINVPVSSVGGMLNASSSSGASSSPSRYRIGVTSSSSVEARNIPFVMAMANEPQMSSSTSSMEQGPSAASQAPVSPPPPANFQLHGEISNPPSPLGGSRPILAGPSRSVSKRDCPDSPLPGPSGSKRFRNAEDPVPGPSGYYPGHAAGASGSGYNSSEAAATSDPQRIDYFSPMPSPPSSPLQAPLTPADNFMISSSTGLIDSVPPTPVDLNGDNDLSVPSPNPVLMNHSHNSNRRTADMDDMIDSTVDSCGLPSEKPEENLDVGEFCHSSRYLDSSDDEEVENKADESDNILGNVVVDEIREQLQQEQQQQQSPKIKKQVSANEENISTSGQVDDGHFRLVPNDPEGGFFNERHPPHIKNEAEQENRPGSSRQLPRIKTSRNVKSSNEIQSSSSSSREPPPPQQQHQQPSVQQIPDMSFSLDGYHPVAFDNNLDFSQDSLENPLPGPSRPRRIDDSVAVVSPLEDDNFLSSADLRLDNFSAADGNVDSNEMDPPLLSSTFNAIDSVSSFGPPVDLEDIQLQKFVPEQYPSSSKASTASNEASGKVLRNNTIATTTNNGFTPTTSSKFVLIHELDMKVESSADDNNVPLPQQQQQSSNISQSAPSGANGLSLGMAFSGIPPSLAQVSTNNNVSSDSAQSGKHQQSSSQHSSILESMTGPLSKRLRTLHSLQQKHSNCDNNASSSNQPLSNGGGGASSSNAPTSTASTSSTMSSNVPGPSSSTSGKMRDKKDNKDKSKNKKSNNNNGDSNEAESSNSSGNGNNNNNNNNNGNQNITHHTYSVMIETTGPAATNFIKPKQTWLEQKSIHESTSDFTHPWEESLDKQDLLPGSLPLIKKESFASFRPKRLRKEIVRDFDSLSSGHIGGPLMIVDTPVLSRARASLPQTHLSIREAKNNGHEKGQVCGVFAKKKIPKSCKFGPVEGKLKKCDSSHQQQEHQPNSEEKFVLTVQTNGEQYEIDTNDEDLSNWMMFVRPTYQPFEKNLSLVQEGDQLFFVANRTINPRQELRVSYSPEYARERNLAIFDEEDNENIWPCFECKKKLQSSEDLQNHLNEHDICFGPTHKSSSSKALKKQVRVIIPDKTRPRDFPCPICPKQFNKEMSLTRHLVLHKGEKKFKCEECEDKFCDLANLTRHKKKMHSYVDQKGLCIRCFSCGLWFRSAPIHQLHMFSHDIKENSHNVEEVLKLVAELRGDRDANAFECPECRMQFEDWIELSHHMKFHGMKQPEDHKDLVGEEDKHHGHGPEQQKRSDGKKKSFKCELCYKSFSSDERLKNHMAVHGTDKDKPLACDICAKRFLNNSALACHLKVHNSEIENGTSAYDCPLCGEVFNQIVNLKEHVHVHCVNGIYSCPHCQKNFPEYSLVRKHIRAFHGEKKFTCSVCSKSFASSDKLKIHTVIHSDVKEFLCTECGKQFRRKDKLKEHIGRMHNNDSETSSANSTLTANKKKNNSRSLENRKKKSLEHQGSLNNKQQTDNNMASEHQKENSSKFVPKVSPIDYHRFIYKCHECLLGFKRRGMLVNHLAKRHPDIPPQNVPELNLPILKTTKDYFCQYCSKVYKSSSKRKSHILKIHPGMNPPPSSRTSNKLLNNSLGGDRPGDNLGMIDSNPNEILQKQTFSATVGSVSSLPHNCPFCHKQYASNAGLLQHQRKKHREKMPYEMQVPRNSMNKAAAATVPSLEEEQVSQQLQVQVSHQQVVEVPHQQLQVPHQQVQVQHQQVQVQVQQQQP